MDYMRGRYIRKTYSRLESMYVRYYELPAAFRATCRTLAQLAILVLLSGIMGWMVGLHPAPCSVVDAPCPRMWCALLWIVAVVGTGHACSSAVRRRVFTTSYILFVSLFYSSVVFHSSSSLRLPSGVDRFGFKWLPVTCIRGGAWQLESSLDPGTFCSGCRIQKQWISMISTPQTQYTPFDR